MSSLCHDCGAREGELHKLRGCDMERCPFCGGQLISCGCAERWFYPTYEFGKKPFSGLPENVYRDGLSEAQCLAWDDALEAQGRIPWIQWPNLCARCGKRWPDMFRVSDVDWERYIEPRERDKMVCQKCWALIVKLTDLYAARAAGAKTAKR
jgi:hypothetical protein